MQANTTAVMPMVQNCVCFLSSSYLRQRKHMMSKCNGAVGSVCLGAFAAVSRENCVHRRTAVHFSHLSIAKRSSASLAHLSLPFSSFSLASSVISWGSGETAAAGALPATARDRFHRRASAFVGGTRAYTPGTRRSTAGEREGLGEGLGEGESRSGVRGRNCFERSTEISSRDDRVPKEMYPLPLGCCSEDFFVCVAATEDMSSSRQPRRGE